MKVENYDENGELIDHEKIFKESRDYLDL